ncbi:MAG: polysaccharide deacetylase family protein [Kofleriaceae bacterium]
MIALARCAVLLVALAAGCQDDIGDIDGAFYDGDGRSVHCAVDLDTVANNSLASIDSALDRAAARGEVAELYAHNPGKTVPLEVVEHVLAGARDRGLAFVTYSDFAASGGLGPGLALSFDDTSVDAWTAARPLFDRYGARVTFFVSRYAALRDDQRAQLVQLAADGHDLEPHSVGHLRAPVYVEEHGLAAYLEDEVIPSIQRMVADGHHVTSFAYPFGARTREIDEAILALPEIAILRSVSFSYTGVVTSPCPR